MNKNTHRTFEENKQVGENGEEFWPARILSKILGYSEFRNFIPVIEKAKQSCENSGQAVDDHFVEMHEMVSIGSGAARKMSSFAISRYGCYLIVQNADPTKPIVAQGQTYFAIQTRRQELADDESFRRLKEDEKRIFLRNEPPFSEYGTVQWVYPRGAVDGVDDRAWSGRESSGGEGTEGGWGLFCGVKFYDLFHYSGPSHILLPGIVNDANDWAVETMGNAKSPLDLFMRVITVSLETMKIVRGVPGLDIG